MMVSSRLFASARELAGADLIKVDVPLGSTVGDLRHHLSQQQPALARILERSALAVNNELADDSLRLTIAAEIALLPPVSGG
jgi:molybdopterin synthase catalytic subunit